MFRGFWIGFWFFAAFGISAAQGVDVAALQDIVDEFAAGNPQAPGVVAYVESPRLGLDAFLVAGAENLGSEAPLTSAHTFRIASNTKTYVAVSVLRLAEQGRLALDDPFGEHLPARYRDLLQADGYDLDAITLRHVLSHTAGLSEHPADPRFVQRILADPHHAWTRDEQIRCLVDWTDPLGTPGERFSYSDDGYILLGAIIEDKTGKNLGQAVRELCGFEALGLNHTWWEILEKKPAGAGPRAHQYFGELDTIDWHPGLDLWGGGGLLTDAHDLGRFMRLLLTGEVLRDEASLAAMTGGGTTDYRLGLIVTELGGHVAYGHTGFWNTFAFHVPALDLTVSGAVLNHHAERGVQLADALVTALDR